MFYTTVCFIREIFKTSEFIPLHEPRFIGNEKKYLNDCIDSTYVSYVGNYVTKFEDMVKDYTGAQFAIAMASGTLSLHIALLLSSVRRGDEVLTQSLTFVASVNAINYCGAFPVFLDSDRKTLGMSAEKLEEFLSAESYMKDDGFSYNKKTGRRISACLPVHIFGHPVDIEKIYGICIKYGIVLVEDAAESLGSFYKNKHTGTFGKFGAVSFNGNKTITTGGGGMLLTDDEAFALKAKHLTTTAKIPHRWEIAHDEIGFNYRMPNVNAAIGCAQMENIDRYLQSKRDLAHEYKEFFERIGIEFISEPADSKSNYWLNAIILTNAQEKNDFLEYTNTHGVMTRPVWTLMHKLPMFQGCQTSNLDAALWLEDRVVNIPSSARI